jgi:hypothetical protein
MKLLRNHIILLQLFLLCEAAHAQQIRFRHVLGNNGYDYGMSAQQTFDNGYIICGSTTSVGSGNTDLYLIKTNTKGIPVNERAIGGINVERGSNVRQTADSGYVVLGYTNDPSSKGYDIYLLKLNAKLETEWEKKYGGSDWDFGNSIKQTSDGGYIICGGTYSYGKGDEDYYLMKTDAQGDTLWTRTYGGSGREEAKSVVQTSDGGYVLTGYSMTTDSLGNFYTVKTYPNGDTVWTHTYGGAQLDLANDIIELSTGSYVVAGETKSTGAGKSDGILVEISTDGITGNIYLAGGAQDDNLQALVERADRKIMFTGTTNSYGFANGKGDLYFGMINSDWSYSMSTTFGSMGKETVNSIGNTNDKGAIICGTTNGFRNLLDDIYLIKTDSTGFSASTETVLITRIEERKNSETLNFSLFPNPVSQTAYVTISSLSTSATLTIYDITGRQLKQQAVRPSNTSVPISVNELANGI